MSCIAQVFAGSQASSGTKNIYCSQRFSFILLLSTNLGTFAFGQQNHSLQPRRATGQSSKFRHLQRGPNWEADETPPASKQQCKIITLHRFLALAAASRSPANQSEASCIESRHALCWVTPRYSDLDPFVGSRTGAPR